MYEIFDLRLKEMEIKQKNGENDLHLLESGDAALSRQHSLRGSHSKRGCLFALRGHTCHHSRHISSALRCACRVFRHVSRVLSPSLLIRWTVNHFSHTRVLCSVTPPNISTRIGLLRYKCRPINPMYVEKHIAGSVTFPLRVCHARRVFC